MTTRKTTAGDVEAAKKRARDLILQQRKLPLEDQWKMAGAIREAKARALVEIEALRLGM